MKEIEFNLLDEPWIRVLTPDYQVHEVSLTDALIHAQDYTALAGELPTQDVAVLRLLLAVLHTVFSRVDETGEPLPIRTSKQALARWDALWQRGHLPEQPIRDYLQTWHERFWLFHPERPFYQIPEAKIGSPYSAGKLNGELSESGNKTRLFPMVSGSGKSGLSYSQSARWLLYVNAFDDTSAKPKGKQLPSPGAGWLGKLGLILAQGDSLFETLMLNLVMLKDGHEVWSENRPCWELEEPHTAERIQIPVPDNPAELLTLQSRRLLLKREKNFVVGFTLLGGDFFEKENTFSEQMTVWRQNKVGKNSPVVFVPARHDPAKQFWREFPTVFFDKPGNYVPGIIRWIKVLQMKRLLDKKRLIRFSIVSVKYGDKDFFVTDAFSDALTFHGKLLEDLEMWQQRITTEIDRCEQLSRQVGYLVRDISIASGNDSESKQVEGKLEKAISEFFFTIDMPFRTWLAAIDPDWPPEQAEDHLMQWQKQAKSIARDLGYQMVINSSPTAMSGRLVNISKEETSHYSSPKAYNRFLRNIEKIYE